MKLRTIIISAIFSLSALSPAFTAPPEILGFLNGNISYNDDQTSFEMTRIRVGFTGELIPQLQYFLITEGGTYSPAGSGHFGIIDAHMTWSQASLLNIRFGQDWYKFSMEGSRIVPVQYFISRSDVVLGIWDNMGRNGFYAEDVGLWIFGEKQTDKVSFGYNFSLTNGTGLGNPEDNSEKDVNLRGYLNMPSGLHLGASVFNGYSSAGNNILHDIAYGFEAEVKSDRFIVGGEYLQAIYEEDQVDPVAYPGINRNGYYLMGGYFFQKVDLLGRYSNYQSNSNADLDDQITMTLGCKYHLSEMNTISLNINQRNVGNTNSTDAVVQFQIVY